jgi:hypothetical protein
VPWISASAALGRAALGSVFGNKAAKQQEAAAKAAREAQTLQFAKVREDQEPYRAAGYEALAQLAGLSNFDPTPTHEQVANEPGYQFGLLQGRNALEGSAAARGGLYSGNALKELTQYANDYASTKYNDAWNRVQTGFGNRWGRLAGLAGIGQSATNRVDAYGEVAARNNAWYGMDAANVGAANQIGQANIWGNALNQFASDYRRNGARPQDRAQAWFSNTPAGRSGFGTGLAYGNEDMGQYF